MPSGDNGRSLTGAAPQARHGVPLQQHNLQGVALRRTCRGDGVRVGGPSVRCRPSAAHRNAPLRGGGGEGETRAAALRRPGPRQRCLDVPVRERRRSRTRRGAGVVEALEASTGVSGVAGGVSRASRAAYGEGRR